MGDCGFLGTLEKSIPGDEAMLERGLTVVPDPMDMEKAPLSSMHPFASSATRHAMYSLTCVWDLGFSVLCVYWRRGLRQRHPDALLLAELRVEGLGSRVMLISRSPTVGFDDATHPSTRSPRHRLKKPGSSSRLASAWRREILVRMRRLRRAMQRHGNAEGKSGSFGNGHRHRQAPAA